MQKNSLMKKENQVIRILEIQEDRVFIINCIKRTMPVWIETTALSEHTLCEESELLELTDMYLFDVDTIEDSYIKKFIREHFTLIAGILPFVSDKKMRNKVIQKIVDEKQVSKQTIRKYLCLYLAYQDISVLAPKMIISEVELTTDEKNMRWALNRYFYNQKKNSIATAYTMMLKERYCDNCVQLLPEHPTESQFRYFEKKNRKLQNYLISRNGLKNYQKNDRPLLGEGVQEYCSSVGVGMLDATILDIYLVNEEAGIVGRPILTACIDGIVACAVVIFFHGKVVCILLEV